MVLRLREILGKICGRRSEELYLQNPPEEGHIAAYRNFRRFVFKLLVYFSYIIYLFIGDFLRFFLMAINYLRLLLCVFHSRKSLYMCVCN